MTAEVKSMEMSVFVRRFMRTKLGTLFLLVLAIALGLFLVNFASAAYSRVSSSGRSSKAEDFDHQFAGRELAGVGGHGGLYLRRKGHKKHHAKVGGPVCKVPSLSLSADANSHAFHSMPPLQCEGEELFYFSNGNIHLNRSMLGNNKLEKCDFRAIEWMTDHVHTYSKTYARTKAPFDIKVKHDFFRVECYIAKPSKSIAGSEKTGGHQSRKLLLTENGLGNRKVNEGGEEDVHAPRLVGSFGMVDIPEKVLEKHAVKHNEAAVKRGLEEIVNQKHVGHHTGPGGTHIPNEADAEAEDEGNNAGEDLGDEDAKELDLEEYDDEYEEFPTGAVPDFDQFVAQIHVKEEVQDRLNDIPAEKNSLGINVLVFALDSMSHLSYQRKLPKTYAYLKDVLNSVIMNGYNIVGDATTAAMLPLLTGHSEAELPEARVNKEGSHFVDIFPFIWNKYEQKGYVTLYAEDQPHFGTFQLRLNGFEQPPVDHYMRPFWQAALQSTVHENSREFCLGSQPEHKFTLDYVRQFFMRYQKIPKFSFAFIGELSHADNNPAEYIDDDLLQFLDFLRNQDVLENTLLIVMGDHGARYSKVRMTVQGKLEERLPFMSLHFPQWFQDKYPQFYQNVKKNRMKLTTPFDIHETLQDLLDIKRAELPVHNSDRGISLLKEIPKNRTCASAGIDLHWCSCMHSEELQITDPRVEKAANLVLEFINHATEHVRDRCHQLRLMEIKNASFVYPNEQVLKFVKNIDADQRVANFSSTYDLDIIHLQVIIETAPNGGLYEGTVQLRLKENLHQVLSEASRINKYNNQPACIIKSHPDLRKYCYCKQKR